MRIQCLPTASDRFPGNLVTEHVTGSVEEQRGPVCLQTLLPGRCFKLRIVISFSLVTIANKEFWDSCATVSRSKAVCSEEHSPSDPFLHPITAASVPPRVRTHSEVPVAGREFPNNSSDAEGVFSPPLFPPVEEVSAMTTLLTTVP